MDWLKQTRLTRLLTALLSTVAPLAHAEAQSFAKVGAVNPNAMGTPPGGADRTLTIGSSIVVKERVRTTDAGSTQLLFPDQSTLNLGSNSDMVIDEYFYNPEAKSGSMVASATKGALRYVGGQISHSSGVTITTPSAVLGIRGGIATIMVALSESIAQLDHNLRGRVGNELVINHFGSITIKNNVSQVTLRPGEATVIASVNQPIAVPFKVSGCEPAADPALANQPFRTKRRFRWPRQCAAGPRHSPAAGFRHRQSRKPRPPARHRSARILLRVQRRGRRLKEQISDEPGAKRGSASAKRHESEDHKPRPPILRAGRVRTSAGRVQNRGSERCARKNGCPFARILLRASAPRARRACPCADPRASHWLPERSPRHRDRLHLPGSHEVEELLCLLEVADVAALDGDRLDRNERQGPRRSASVEADHDELAAAREAIEAELRRLRIAHEIDRRPQGPSGFFRDLARSVRRGRRQRRRARPHASRLHVFSRRDRR